MKNLILNYFKGNLLVLYLFVKYKSLRTKTNFLLGNMAVADFLVSILCIAPSVLRVVYHIFGNAVNSKMKKAFKKAIIQK
jgi:hypothetical protein